MSDVSTAVLIIGTAIVYLYYTYPIYKGETCDTWTCRLFIKLGRLFNRRDSGDTRRKRRVRRVSRHRPRGP